MHLSQIKQLKDASMYKNIIIVKLTESANTLGVIPGKIDPAIIIMMITIVAALLSKETFNKDLNFVEK